MSHNFLADKNKINTCVLKIHTVKKVGSEIKTSSTLCVSHKAMQEQEAGPVCSVGSFVFWEAHKYNLSDWVINPLPVWNWRDSVHLLWSWLCPQSRPACWDEVCAMGETSWSHAWEWLSGFGFSIQLLSLWYVLDLAAMFLPLRPPTEVLILLSRAQPRITPCMRHQHIDFRRF